MEDIIQYDFKSFKVVLFVVKWYRLRLNQHDPDRTMFEHDNGFTMVNTRFFEPRIEPYVLPSQCEQVFYSEFPGKASWPFVVRHDPRGRLVKYNLDKGNEESTLEEEDNDEDHHQHDKLDDHDDPAEYVQKLVESNDVADNAHEDYIDDDMMIITNVDDDYDMANPYNVNSGSDDTDDDLNEEEDEIYRKVNI